MDLQATPPGAPDKSAIAKPPTRTNPVFSALVRGLSDEDAQFVAEAMQRAKQATIDADSRGETASQPVW